MVAIHQINFAHQTFKWNNEGKGVAGVHCVIIGFSNAKNNNKILYTYSEPSAEPISHIVTNINPYLLNASNIFITNRDTPISNVPPMRYGNMPRDGGNLLLTLEEKEEILRSEPNAEKWIRKFVGAEDLINNSERYCLWLVDIEPNELSKLPKVLKRVEKTKQFRLDSKAESTRKFASTPQLFCQIAQPHTSYLAFPRHSSERRAYLPISYVSNEVIASDALLTVEDAKLHHFSVINSSMHNAWMKSVCGRLESRYRYSKDIVYNNFIWCDLLSEDLCKLLDERGNVILEARNLYPNASLADLYDPLTMPIELVKAHEANNKAVDKAYGYTGADDDASRVAFLFKRYEELTSLLPPTVVKKKRAKKQDDAQTNLI